MIPARYGSTRLPAKPLIDLGGKPMIQHVYERALKASLVGEVIVLTDHREIASAVGKFGGKALMTPSDIPSGSDRIAYAARTRADADIIVNVQGDEPLINPKMIDEAIRPLLDDPSVKIATLVKKISGAADLQNPGLPKVVLDEKGFAIYFSRSPIPYLRDEPSQSTWHLRHVYYKHIGLYVYRREALLRFSEWGESPLERAERLEQLRFIEHGYRIKAVVTKHDSAPVDTAEDVENIRRILQEHSWEQLP
jgi:3-deoxy-manno-octulosonate cytidylyltransferase (CMP-KDO synthetase)